MNFADFVVANIRHQVEGNRFIQRFDVGSMITYQGSIEEERGNTGIVTHVAEVLNERTGNFDWRYKVVLVSGTRLSMVREKSLARKD